MDRMVLPNYLQHRLLNNKKQFMQQQQPPKLNIDLKKTTPFTCDVCGNSVFQEGVLLRKASKFLTGTMQDAIVPVPVFCCSKCGHVNESFLPPDIRSTDDTEDTIL
jgi:DNA-directed RNA polymerase subunit M/transcription elongation factor TFIIS